MKKIRVAVAFGGKSPEHEVSVITGLQIIEYLDKEQFDVIPLYVSKDGEFYTGDILRKIETYKDLTIIPLKAKKVYFPFDKDRKGFKYSQEKKVAFLQKDLFEPIDIIFPCFHGGLGENGGFQAFCEIAEIPYVGSAIAGSINGMDKVLMKDLFKANGIPMVDYIWFYRNKWEEEKSNILKDIEKKLKYPLFVKPSNAGSSIGVSKAKTQKELIIAIEVAMQFDRKIIVEEGFENAREINISVMGNTGSTLEASVCEEVTISHGILTYEDKYVGDSKKSSGMASAKRKVPADLPKDIEKELAEIGKKVFAILDCSGLSRIDFLVNEKKNKIVVLEINTIPGSMSFYLWEASGLPFQKMITKLITLGMDRYNEMNKNVTTFPSNILANFNPSLKAPKRIGR
jgi:D-alanine-D-alanine ligase